MIIFNISYPTVHKISSRLRSPCARPNIGTKHVNRFHYDFLLAQYLNCSKMADGHFFILLSVTLAAIFKHGSRFLAKLNFRKMSLTFDTIHLSTCKWDQIICIKILHLLVCTLQGFVMLITWILQINDRKVEFKLLKSNTVNRRRQERLQ